MKRTHQPYLTHPLAKRPTVLKGKHFIYETVEDTDERPPEDLQIVLTEFVEGKF